MVGPDTQSSWRFPVGASLCGIGGIGAPMHMDLLGGHTLGSITLSAVVLGLFAAAAFWMFRRWGGPSDGVVTLAQEHNDAMWAELEREPQLDRASVTETRETDEVVEPV